jgi:hypothetical protein
MTTNDSGMVQTSSQVRRYIMHDANKPHTSKILQIQVYKSIIVSNMMQTSSSTNTPHVAGHNGEY